MRRYFSLAIANFMETIAYKTHLLLTFISNIIYIVLIYFLWKQIFVATNGTIAGMNFEKTFLYISSASCISTLYITWVDAHIADSILNGNIVMKLLRPMDYMLYMIFEKLGTVMSNCVIIFLPTMLFLGIIFKGQMMIGINIIFLIISLFLGFIINFCLEFLIGVSAFRFESIWGLTTLKGIVVQLLAGGIMPIVFFPRQLRKLAMILPFQGIYNTPIEILMGHYKDMSVYAKLICVQAGWAGVLFVICKVTFLLGERKISVNGG